MKHENRIAALNAGITVRNNKPTEEERKEVESREIEKYFKATGTDRTAEGMLSALKEGKFQNDQLKETGKREYAAYLNRQNAGLQYLYGSKTDAAASSAELVNYYFKYFGEDQDKEDLNRFLERMRQNQDEKQQKENLRRYQEVQLTEQTRAEGMEYSHWEILERLKKMPKNTLGEIKAVVSAYISMGGGKEYVESEFFEVTPRALLEYGKTNDHGKDWLKHNERFYRIRSLESKGWDAVINEYESIIDNSSKTILGANFYNKDTLKKLFIERLTPAYISKREGDFLKHTAANIDSRLNAIAIGTDKKTPAEEREKAFQKDIKSGTRFGKKKWDWMGVNSMVGDKVKELSEDENYTNTDALLRYENEKIEDYRQRVEQLDKPVKILNEAINELTGMIKESQEAIEELEKIQEDPKKFFTTGDLTNNVLTDVGKQYDTMEEAVNTQKPLKRDVQEEAKRVIVETNIIPDIDISDLLAL